MEDFGKFEADTTQNDYDNDFERLDANDEDDERALAGENPEEDLYSAEPPSQSGIPEGDLLGGFSAGGVVEEPPSPEPEGQVPENLGGFDTEFGAPIPTTEAADEEPPAAPFTSTANSEPEEDLLGLGTTSTNEFSKPDEPEPEEPAAPAPVIESQPEYEQTQLTAPQESSSDTTPALGALVDFSKLDPRVVELLYWRDPKKTGIVFGSILLALIALSCCSFISVLAYLLLAVMTVTISFRVYKSVMQAVQKTGDGNPFRAYLEVDLTLSPSQVEAYTSKAVEKINAHIGCLRHVLLVEDLVDSVKFAVVLWLLTYVGAWFNGLTLIILAFISLFSFPIVYEKYQTQIDEAVGKAQHQINTTMDGIKTKIPWLKKKED